MTTNAQDPTATQDPTAAQDSTAAQYSPLLVIARNAAVLAFERMAHWRARLAQTSAVHTKGNPNDLVTEADKEIEAIVTGYLTHVRPGDAVVGEENVAVTPFQPGGATEAPASPTNTSPQPGLLPVPSHANIPPCEWHVDPIDGTVNFVRGIEHHCFSVGVRIRDAQPAAHATWLAGLVAAPIMDTTWFAARGAGAWMTRGLPAGAAMSTPAQVPSTTRLTGTPAGRQGRVVATGFGYAKARRDRQLAALARVMEEFDDVRRMGSAAIDLCQVAQGRVDAYYERGLGIYDWAAGALIAREAGCHVYTPQDRDEPVVAANSQADVEYLRARG